MSHLAHNALARLLVRVFGFVAFWGVIGTRGLGRLGLWWAQGRRVRVIYNASVDTIEATVQGMRVAGKSSKEIAEAVIAIQNGAKGVGPRAGGRRRCSRTRGRNLAKYGDKIGPSVEWMLIEGGAKGIKERLNRHLGL